METEVGPKEALEGLKIKEFLSVHFGPTIRTKRIKYENKLEE